MTGAELLERVMADWRDCSVRSGLGGTSRFVKLLPSVRLRATDAAEAFLLGRTTPAPWDVDEEHMPEGLGRLLVAYEEALVGDETPDTARAIEEGVLVRRAVEPTIDRVAACIAADPGVGAQPAALRRTAEEVIAAAEDFSHNVVAYPFDDELRPTMRAYLEEALRQSFIPAESWPELARRLAREVFSPFAAPKRCRRWRITLASEVTVDDEAVASGPEAGLYAFARALHILNYPEVTVGLRRAFRLGEPGLLDRFVPMRARLEEVRAPSVFERHGLARRDTRPAMDAEDVFPGAWIRLLDAGKAPPVPELSVWTAHYIHQLANAGVSAESLMRSWGIARPHYFPPHPSQAADWGLWDTTILQALPLDVDSLAWLIDLEPPHGWLIVQDMLARLDRRGFAQALTLQRWDRTPAGVAALAERGEDRRIDAVAVWLGRQRAALEAQGVDGGALVHELTIEVNNRTNAAGADVSRLGPRWIREIAGHLGAKRIPDGEALARILVERIAMLPPLLASAHGGDQ